MSTIIYALVDPHTNEARYVGKTGNAKVRFKEHCKAIGTTRKENWIKSIRPMVPIMVELEIVKDWLEAEIFWIAYMKSLGARLTNHTIGGEGVIGYIYTDEVKARMSIASKICHADPVRKARRTAALKATMANPQFKAKMVGVIKDSHARPDVKAKMRKANSVNQNKPEAKIARSEIAKALWANPEFRAKMTLERNARWESEEYRAKMSESMKKLYTNPDYVAKKKAAMNTPEFKANMSAIKKRQHAVTRLA